MTREHIYQIKARERNIRALAEMDTSDKPEADKLGSARSLFRATIRHAYDSGRLAEAQNDSANYSSKWAIRKIERWEAKHERHEESLQSRWGAYGLRMSWSGPYWPIIDSQKNGSVIGRQVINLVPYK